MTATSVPAISYASDESSLRFWVLLVPMAAAMVLGVTLWFALWVLASPIIFVAKALAPPTKSIILRPRRVH